MALLTTEKRIKYFKKLGLGDYNKANITKLQKKYFRKKDVDGVYGIDTDRLLRHVYNCSLVPNFEPEEFKCTCGHCTGYPSYMKQVELKHLQTIRNHYKKPMTITSGLRCKYDNEHNCTGSIKNSKHLSGYACDFYMEGVTDTLAHRKAAIKYIKKLPNHNYTYGNGINSNGASIAASYMGNAMHTDTNKPKATSKPKKTKPEKSVEYAEKFAENNAWHYVTWVGNDIKTQTCAICHHYTGKYKGFNCIRFVFTCWHHGGGIPCEHEGGLIHNELGNRMYKASVKDATKMAQKALGCKDIMIIRNKNGIPSKLIKPGDACMVFNGNKYAHMTLAAGNGMIIHAQGSSGKVPIDKQIEKRKAYKCQMLIRYIGE